jgi:hypothetical protein
MKFVLPPRIKNSMGVLRKVGFEIEFGGIGLKKSAQIIAKALNSKATPDKTKNYSYNIESKMGQFSIEADSTALQESTYKKYIGLLGLQETGKFFEEQVEFVLNKLVGTLIPVEIATPPLPINNLEVVEELRKTLCRHKAQGTKSFPLYTFAMQFNPELPDLSAATILAYLQSFLLLYNSLYKSAHIPLSRKVSPFIRPFPRKYIELVLDNNYKPELKQLIMDYLKYNPTRNRPLDLLPLFTYLDLDLVFAHPVEKSLIKPRPTLHYRLPNCEVDDSRWSIAKEWNNWVEVEKLAFNNKLRAQMIFDYHRIHSKIFAKRKWLSFSKRITDE